MEEGPGGREGLLQMGRGQEKSEENAGVGSPGEGEGRVVTLALATSMGQVSDTSWMQVCGGGENPGPLSWT